MHWRYPQLVTINSLLFIIVGMIFLSKPAVAAPCKNTYPGGSCTQPGEIYCLNPVSPTCALPTACQQCACPGGLVSCVVSGEVACQASQEGQPCNYSDSGAPGNDGKQDKCGACNSCADGFIDCRSNNQGCLTTTESNALKTATSCPSGQAPNSCGVCETLSYTPAYLNYYQPQQGYLTVTGTSDPAAPEGALYYKSGTGLRVKGASAWQDVGKVYSGTANQLTVDNTTNNISFATNPIVVGNLTVGTNAPLPLFVDVTNKRVTVQNFNALDKVKLIGNVGIGGVNNTSKKLLVLGEGEISNDWKVGSLTLGNITKSSWPSGVSDQIVVDNTANANTIGFVLNPKIAGNLQVNGSSGFGAYNPDPNWRISTPNLYVGAGAGQPGTIIGAGSGQAAGDIKTDGRLIVAGNLKKLQSGTTDCPSGTVWLDFNGNSTKQDGECYDAPDAADAGHGVFGGQLHVSKLLSGAGGLKVTGPTTIFDPTNLLIVASGNIAAKQLNLTQKLTIAPTPDSTVAEQYALRIVDNSGNEWFSVKRTGSIGNASVNADTIHVSTLGSFSAPKLSTTSRFDTPTLVVNAANTFPSAGVKFFVSGDSELQGKLTVVGEFKIDSLKTPTVHFESTNNPFHIEGEEALRIQPDVQLNGRLWLKNDIEAMKDENGNVIVSDGKLRLDRISPLSFDSQLNNASNEGYLVLMALPGIACSTVCLNHQLSCNNAVPNVISLNTFNGKVSGTNCSSTTDRRLCPCGGI